MSLQAQLSHILPASRVHTRLIDRIAYANDASYFRLAPQAVAQPDSVGELQALFRFSQQERLPMAFRAAGTNLTGQAITDGILVDISKHWERYSIEDNGTLLRAQPGLVGGFLNNALKPYGRRIGPDPASLDACMLGGILANNSGGMCCGVTENAYQTLRSMTVVLPNGFVIDSAAPHAAAQLHEGAPDIERGLLDLAERIQRNAPLAGRIRSRYRMKNTNGYALNAFLDFDSPLDILIHLMIGSEGTLGFIAEAVLRTLPVLNHKTTAQLYFQTIQDAAAAIAPLEASGARAAEIMDRASLRSVEAIPGAPPILRELPGTAAAILVEYQAEDAETLRHFQQKAVQALRGLRLLHDAEFTQDPAAQAALWKPRKGIIPTVGAMRAPGTTSLIEDVLFPVPRLAEAVTDLQALFEKYDYPEGVVFGHAKDGNLHFLINQSFDAAGEIERFERFSRDLVALVSGKYDGALKTEHGTGRNMAPFVATEWGAEAYDLMREIKSLFDPDGMLNPGVLLNDDPRAHVTHLKSFPLVAPEIDQCIECGFCESKCPSRRLTLTPRQRIVVQREIARLEAAASDSPALASLMDDFAYAGVETCAADSLCAAACPVGIDTGNYIKHLRARSVESETSALWLAENFALAEKAVGWGVRAGHFLDKISGTKWHGILPAAERLTGAALPKWNRHIPFPAKRLPATASPAEFIYFPSCISRQLGVPNSNGRLSLTQTFLTLAQRARVAIQIPAEAEGHCCGMPFASKGYTAAYRATLHKTIRKFWDWSEGGKHPIVIDTTSCTHTLRTCSDGLDDEDKELWKQLTILDGVEFLHDHLLPKLEIHPLDEEVILHPNCSARKLGLDAKLLAIAKKCARSASVPLDLGCCAFAGDRGLLFPELTRSATQKESAEVLARDYDGYYSSNITCEIGMSEATGKDYVSIVYLVEKASR
ncbi:MAG: FAD-binding and (Fe-S)-binding domain-containing protein [Chloroflexota bacterium]